MFSILQINQFDDSLLADIQKHQSENSKGDLHLIVNQSMTEHAFVLLEQFIHEAKPFPCNKLSLKIDPTLLKNPKLLSCLHTLNQTNIQSLELDVIVTDETRDMITQSLIHHIAPIVSYPIHIKQHYEELSEEKLLLPIDEFQNRIIANIQKRYSEGKGKVQDEAVQDQRKSDPQGKKIRLKAIAAQKNHQDIPHSQYVAIELEHVEEVEHQVEAQQEELVQVQVNVNVQEVQQYDGQLIDFDAFNKPIYKNKVASVTRNAQLMDDVYDLLSEECFANLAEGVKYLTPEAAEQLALNLPAYVTLNKENLPDGFLLKQTAKGEWVLDYDAYLENERKNAFTPSVLNHQITASPIYDISLDKNNVQRLMSDALKNAVCPTDETLKSCINLWIKYGDSGLQTFFQQLEAAASHDSQLIRFIFEKYLNYIPQWDYFYETPAFYNALSRISRYDQSKLDCLKRFLLNTGSSQTDLQTIVTAFELFWAELNQLCAEQKVTIQAFNQGQWFTPEGGNPLVFMERLLTILKNARNLGDQFKGLSGKDTYRDQNGLLLTNYGAYYASRYEGFFSVCPEMRFDYHAENLNKHEFNKNKSMYKFGLDFLNSKFVDWNKYMELLHFQNHLQDQCWLIKFENELPQPLNLKELQDQGLAIPFDESKFRKPYQLYQMTPDGQLECLLKSKPTGLPDQFLYALGLRVIGQQSHGITVSSLIEQFKDHLPKSHLDLFKTTGFMGLLYFVSHERYLDHPLDELIQQLESLNCHRETVTESIDMLQKLYDLDIKLNEKEGLMFFESLAGMNSAEFQQMFAKKGKPRPEKFKDLLKWKEDPQISAENAKTAQARKVESIQKLFHNLVQNKYATFRLFNSRGNQKWPFLFAFDTADFLANDPAIDMHFHDDLLIFGHLITSSFEQAYFHARQDELAKTNLDNLTQVRTFLHQAAVKEKPNNLYYAFKAMLNSRYVLGYSQCIQAFRDIESLPTFDSPRVDDILSHYNFRIRVELPEIFNRDDADLKEVMIALIIRLQLASEHLEEADQIKTETLKRSSEMRHQTLTELHESLKQAWGRAGPLLLLKEKLFVQNTLKIIRDVKIQSAFGQPSAEARPILEVLAKKVAQVSDFQDYADFEKLNFVVNQATNIAALVNLIRKNPFVAEHELLFADVLKEVDFSKLDYETLYRTFSLLLEMPQRHYLPLIKLIMTNSTFYGKKEITLKLLDQLTVLNHHFFPSEYLESFTQMMLKYPGHTNEFCDIQQKMVSVFGHDNKDPILQLIMSCSELSLPVMQQILAYSENISFRRDQIALFLKNLNQTQDLGAMFHQFAQATSFQQPKLLEILSIVHAGNREKFGLDYQKLTQELMRLSNDNLSKLLEFVHQTPVSELSLLNALKALGPQVDFDQFLQRFEKEPFGPRDYKKQFSCAEIERVINDSTDGINQTKHSYQYRKQVMEALLFVNEVGESLPVYYHKAAKDLSNQEIKAFLSDIKQQTIPGLTSFQRRLLALGLIREAIYRTTGQFPYPTQMKALVDCILHAGDLNENINTGQGKSLIDSAKTILIWLESDRVEYTTSSMIDVKRDIETYGPLLKLLGIPYSEKPISSTSTLENFKTNGINFSTFPQLSLFFAKAKATGLQFETPETRVSLVCNESDHAILDDRVIYRFATPDNSGIGYGQEWIYGVINEFVDCPDFIHNDKATIADDVFDLKAYLRIRAKELGNSSQIIDKFSDEQYLSWLESSVTVNFLLEENKDYVIPDEFEKCLIRGREYRTKVVKVLMKDNKVSPDSMFGNGIQQLLYARLNKQRGTEEFVIQPQNKTIVASNNRNLIQYYRSKEGIIWGSSGTVGAVGEIEEQYAKYGFEFVKEEPHQANIVQYHAPMALADEAEQFEELIRQITKGDPAKVGPPHLVFCKDINTATRLFKFLENRNPKQFPLQLYTGLGQEEDYIRHAAESNRITITTSALGRNTDVPYDKQIGLDVWHLSPNSTRAMAQISGRTGRNGSPGQVHFIFNHNDLGGKNLEQIQAEIDDSARIERSYNEDLYDVLGYLLNQVETIPDEHFTRDKSVFLRENWSKFNSNIEARYREIRHGRDYSQDQFIRETLVAFHQMLRESTHVERNDISFDTLKQSITNLHSQRERYIPWHEPIKIKDCTPPRVIAYHLLGTTSEDPNPEQTKVRIKKRLKQLFSKIDKSSAERASKDYLYYLAENPTQQTVLVQAHQEFLKAYLNHHGKKRNFIQRLLGLSGMLSQVTDNQHYLTLFYSFTSIPEQSEPMVGFDMMRQSVLSLLDEYLDTSWFINSDRLRRAKQLKAEVAQAKNLDALLALLTQSQSDVARQDIELCKKSGKSLHFFGHSRYQETLSRAINLTASLSHRNVSEQVREKLSPLLADASDGKELQDLSYDSLAQKANCTKRDKRNATVLLSSLDSALWMKNQQEPVGMVGRQTLFRESISQARGAADEGLSPKI